MFLVELACALLRQTVTYNQPFKHSWSKRLTTSKEFLRHLFRCLGTQISCLVPAVNDEPQLDAGIRQSDGYLPCRCQLNCLAKAGVTVNVEDTPILVICVSQAASSLFQVRPTLLNRPTSESSYPGVAQSSRLRALCASDTSWSDKLAPLLRLRRIL